MRTVTPQERVSRFTDATLLPILWGTPPRDNALMPTDSDLPMPSTGPPKCSLPSSKNTASHRVWFGHRSDMIGRDPDQIHRIMNELANGTTRNRAKMARNRAISSSESTDGDCIFGPRLMLKRDSRDEFGEPAPSNILVSCASETLLGTCLNVTAVLASRSRTQSGLGLGNPKTQIEGRTRRPAQAEFSQLGSIYPTGFDRSGVSDPRRVAP